MPPPAAPPPRPSAPPAAVAGPAAAPPRRRRSIVWRLRRVFFGLALLGIAGLAGVGYVLANVALPDAEPTVETTFVYAADGTKLAELSAGENRVSKRLDEMSPNLIDAVLSAEDRRFFDHNGVNVTAIGRALLADLRGKPLQGGSTITQQYVKVTYLDRERTLVRKLKEATLAVKLERRFSKEEILERYLNAVYFGRGAYGAQAASQAYFGVDVGDLDVRQAAYLAGLLRAPEMADANRADKPEQADEANRRRNLVIRAMQEEGHIPEAEVQEIADVPVRDYVRPREEVVRDRIAGKEFGTEYFVELVRREMAERYGETRLTGGGLQIHTTLDLDMQRKAYETVYAHVGHDDGPTGALVSLDADGHVKAMVGGKDYEASSVNLALGSEGGGSGRPAGSTFKPFALAELLRQGYSVNSIVESPGKKAFDVGGSEPYEPSNFNGASHGDITVAKATEVSSNTGYVSLVEQLGVERVLGTARDVGVRTSIPESDVNLSVALGSASVSVIDMADGYLTFARRGEQVDPLVVTRVESSQGEVIEEFEPDRDRVLEQNQADVVNSVLQRVVRSGTGTRAAIGQPVAGKTGTTQDSADAWFVGYTPGLSTAVWMGHPEGSVPMPGETGGGIPATIFREYMSQVVTPERYGGDFVAPSSLDGKMLGGRVVPSGDGPRGRDGGGERTTTTTAPEVDDTTSTTVPSTTTSTTATTLPSSTTTSTTQPPWWGGGGGQGGDDDDDGEPPPTTAPAEQTGNGRPRGRPGGDVFEEVAGVARG